MPAKLTKPKQAVVLDKVRIANIQIENNPYLKQYWVDVYLVLGREADGVWEQHVQPNDGAIAFYYRIAPGCNPHARPSYFGQGPLGDGPALGRCNKCETWHPLATGPCHEECDGEIQPYDGFQRLANAAPVGKTNYEAIKNAVYNFLISEEVPAMDGEVRPLLSAVKE